MRRFRFVFVCDHHSSSSSLMKFVFIQVYAILDEIFLAGEIEETSKEVVLSRLEELEKLE